MTDTDFNFSPLDLNLPPKFSTFHKHQLETVLTLANSPTQYHLLNAPTGSGKSLIYLSLSQLLQARTLILTSNRSLQDQLLSDFTPTGLVDIRGRDNYRCKNNKFKTCRAASELNLCNLADNCTYLQKVSTARQSPLVITNYHYWLSIGRYSDPTTIGDFDLLVLDEAHSAPDILTEFCSVTLNSNQLHKFNIDLPSIVNWQKSIRKCLNSVSQSVSWARSSKQPQDTIVELSRIQDDLKFIINDLDSHTPADWIPEQTNTGLKITPVWGWPFAQRLLFRSVPKIVLTSATITESTAKNLGLDPTSYTYTEVPSTFSPKRAPFIWVKTCRVDKNMLEGHWRKLASTVDRIIDARLDRKGIIHTRSYDKMKQLVSRSRYEHLFIYGRNPQKLVQQFINSKAPCVLVSPAIEEGVDFKHDLARYAILLKVPFLYLGDPITKARHKQDKSYIYQQAAQSIEQQAGRVMRNPKDWGEIFILDDHWSYFRGRYKNEFSKHFKRTWKVMDRPPDPPPLDGSGFGVRLR